MNMKKITLLFSLLFVAVLTAWGQSTFTILPKFQVGDTLVYEAITTSGKTMEDVLPSVNLGNRKFYLIVKGKDREGNLKVDYLLKEAKMEDKTEVIKDLPNIEEVDKFFKEDIVKTPIQLTLDKAGRLLKVDNKDEVNELFMKRMQPVLLEFIGGEMKHKLTAKEIEEAKEVLRSEFDITEMLEEIPALFKYYGQPLMEGKSETVDSVTTKYAVARMDDGTTWVKANIDLMNGDEEMDGTNPEEGILEENTNDDEDFIDEGFDSRFTATSVEDYKFNKEGIVTYMKAFLTFGNKDVSETDTTISGGTEVKLIEIKKGVRQV